MYRWRSVVFDPERDVALELLVQPLTQLARRDELAVLAGERRVVDEEVHADGGLLDADALEPAPGLRDR